MTRDIEGIWFNCALGHWTGRGWCVDDSSEIPSILVTTDQLVSDIARSTGDQFCVQKDRQGREIVRPTVLGQRILDWGQRLDVSIVSSDMNRHSFSPYFDLLKDFRDERGLFSIGLPPPALVPQANQWVDSMREQARAPSIKKAVESRERSASKNSKGARKYVSALLRRYTTLLVVPVDLGYHHDPLRVGPNVSTFSDEQVDVHLKQLRSFARQKLPGFVGMIWQLGYSVIRGHYCHLTLFFDGCLAFDRHASGQILAGQWSALTHAYGTCWIWCSVDRSRQRHINGIVSVSDEDACRRLVKEVMSLARLDYYARFESPIFKRTFGKGEITGKLVLRERPRKAAKLRITRAMRSV